MIYAYLHIIFQQLHKRLFALLLVLITLISCQHHGIQDSTHQNSSIQIKTHQDATKSKIKIQKIADQLHDHKHEKKIKKVITLVLGPGLFHYPIYIEFLKQLKKAKISIKYLIPMGMNAMIPLFLKKDMDPNELEWNIFAQKRKIFPPNPFRIDWIKNYASMAFDIQKNSSQIPISIPYKILAQKNSRFYDLGNFSLNIQDFTNFRPQKGVFFEQSTKVGKDLGTIIYLNILPKSIILKSPSKSLLNFYQTIQKVIQKEKLHLKHYFDLSLGQYPIDHHLTKMEIRHNLSNKFQQIIKIILQYEQEIGEPNL